ncbi:NAD(P)/FAD-dependent oxidoreductase [Oerskovia sp. Sa1BUA8]|uniref:NAD(P)/FAD-dependent oxidoreductase n=1 Tax=Oerskovia douganii TaxID=2762210 RepID=A0A9D5UFA5_9CELL|nr:NAD(P)/FAD-dependent oxidoreductase [Oerskovia douganii]MBE7701991.1 NAD(P)/FAD-dependent oxidoreductase [Oerskovia douganii]
MTRESTTPATGEITHTGGAASTYDVVVVGGGAAGLSGALTLARARRSVLVIDAGRPRNAPAAHMHGYLSRDGEDPATFLAVGRGEVTAYGGRITHGAVESAVPLAGGGFEVRLADGRDVGARRLLVTTGLLDELPAVPGVAERWGKDVLHCPYCHGWEVRDQAVGILATSPMSLHHAQLWRQWTDDVTLFLHEGPAPDAVTRAALDARGVRLVEGPVEALDVQDGVLSGVRLASGEVVPCAALVVAPRFTGRSALLESLGIETVEQEVDGTVVGTYVPSDPMGATSVPGVRVAGNVTHLMAQVVAAAAAGVQAAAAINGDLIAEDVREAVARAATGERADDGPQAATGKG